MKAYAALSDLNFVPKVLAYGIRPQEHEEENALPFIVLTFLGPVLKRDLSQDEWVVIRIHHVPLIHERGIHHHDIHGGNVIQKLGGELGLIDFHLCCPLALCQEPCPDVVRDIF
ncbi:hypothetical protein FA15DRAFT_669373 [Coprinopsis marcescibilis]|uniref:Protein kinase domain-containing protein n=1 Tax=Coprinopsis marcescibilis TaxID=230819 RepID=A0A5C3KVS1_COPMA|nr:hypothetical protein FA15DRAFT_669373 [Coprinopsis marcescibilis]